MVTQIQTPETSAKPVDFEVQEQQALFTEATEQSQLETERSRWPEAVGKMDQLIVGAIGMTAVIGEAGSRAGMYISEYTNQRFDLFGQKINELKENVKQGAHSHFEKQYHKRVSKSQGTNLDSLSKQAKIARKRGQVSVATDTSDQMGKLINRVSPSRMHHWAVRLGLAPSETAVKAKAHQHYKDGVNKIAPFPLDARDAKAKGDWMGYQKALLTLADETEARDATPASKERYIKQVDSVLGATAVESVQDTFIRDQRKERVEAIRSDIKHWMKPDRVMELKSDIDSEVAKAVQEAQILGGHTQIGFDKEQVKKEITEKYLERYFSAKRNDRWDRDIAPKEVQRKIRNLLKLSSKDLAENLAG